MAVEEALDELLASDTHYRRELNVQIASRIAVAEGKRRARTLELKEVRRQFRWNDSRIYGVLQKLNPKVYLNLASPVASRSDARAT